METQENTTNRKARTALVSGASRGLGRALATSLADDGWRLIIDGRNADALAATAADLGARTEVVAVPGDVADPDHREDLMAVVHDLGGVDVVVHNASTLGPADGGDPRLHGLADYPLDGLRRVLEVNTLAPLALTQLLLPLIRPGGRVVAVTSDAAVEAYEGWGGYGAAKAALDQVFAVLAEEHPDLRIYRVDPGEMRTRMYREAAPDDDLRDLPLPEVSIPGVRRLIDGDLPSGRYEARRVEGTEGVATRSSGGAASSEEVAA
jgi:NAD(P)-dependent dehydrogenase (short-subunit alcohol dehydrogenase family)